MLNHDYAQTVEFWEEGFNEAAMLSVVDDVRSNLVATLYPEADSYALGETISYDVKVKSWTLLPIGAFVVVDAVLPTGNTWRLRTAHINFFSAEEKIFGLQHAIPLSVATGDYKIRVQVGVPPDDLLSADYFDFTITP